MKEQENIADSKVWSIDKEKALQAPERISKVVEYILEHFNQKTKRNDRSYEFSRLQNIKEMASVKNQKTLEEIKAKVRL